MLFLRALRVLRGHTMQPDNNSNPRFDNTCASLHGTAWDLSMSISHPFDQSPF